MKGFSDNEDAKGGSGNAVAGLTYGRDMELDDAS